MTAPAQQQHAHAAQPPPDQNDLVAAVAALILTGGAVLLLAAAIYALLHRRRRRVTLEAVTAAVALTSTSTAHRPRMVGRSDVARAQQRLEAHYRAAYIIHAAERITARAATLAAVDHAAGGAVAARKRALRMAVRNERRFLEQHRRARAARMQAAAAVAEQADRYGPELGWHAVLDGHATPECRAADGSNFTIDAPPAIGWPGTLHGGRCRCRPGAPFPYGRHTDAQLAAAGLLGAER